MFIDIFRNKLKPQKHDVDLKPGDNNYRAYVGPPRDYDLVSAMVFNLLTCVGLQQQHKVLDIGCGSLRVGRLLIPYLNSCNYYGIEPNKWLVSDGIKNEIGQDMLDIKKPVFSYNNSMKDFQIKLDFNYAIAQSIFSHCGIDLLKQWLSEVSFHLHETGALFATFVEGDTDFKGNGWIYPGCVKYKPETISQLALDSGLEFEILDWSHPRQTWAIFSKKKYDKSMIGDNPISWNRYCSQRDG